MALESGRPADVQDRQRIATNEVVGIPDWVWPFVLVAIVAVAVLFRLYALMLQGGFDQDQFAWARQFHAGGIVKFYLEMRDSIRAGDWRHMIVDYPPGYPLFLAALDWAGLGLRGIRVVQALLDAAAIVPLYYVARELIALRPLVLLCCALYAVASWMAVGSSYLLAEGLIPAFTICLLALMLWVRRRPNRLWRWILLGLFASLLPFFRPEMSLLFAPLAAWAFLIAPHRRRMRFAAAVVIVFLIPLFAWAARNEAVHGSFMLTPPVKWYVLWSGLGQVPNDYGYITNDERARALLQSMGIGYHTPGAEAYWRAQYLDAWQRHPLHVLHTVLFRLSYIATSFDLAPFMKALGNIIYKWLPWTALIAMIWLVRKRRQDDAFLVAGPLLYAVLALGLMYVEARYVRYVALTYFLALPIFFELAGSAVAAARKEPYAPALQRALPWTPLIALLLYVAIAFVPLPQQVSAAEQQAIRRNNVLPDTAPLCLDRPVAPMRDLLTGDLPQPRAC